MTHAGKEEEGGPGEPACPVLDAEVDEAGDDCVGGDAVEAGRERVEDVAAIQLAGR